MNGGALRSAEVFSKPHAGDKYADEKAETNFCVNHDK
jgi:hypothetical protein